MTEMDKVDAVQDVIASAEMPQETVFQAAERLAKLHPLEYQQVRKYEAKSLGIDQITVLDKEVDKLRKQESNYDEKFPEVEPWPQTVNASELLDEITKQIERFIVCAPETANTSALWIAFTWIIDFVQVAPIAFITAPEMQCGKSQLLSVIGSMVKKPAVAANISPSVVFRVIEKYCPTLLIDEADSFMNGNDDLRGIINSGHTRQTAYVWRSVGEEHEPMQFSTWGAKALCGIGTQAATIMDRSIVLELRRKLDHERVERLRHADKSLFLEIRQKLARFALQAGESIEKARPSLPETLSDRAQDNWEPLLAIADYAGGHWPETARKSALVVFGKSMDKDNQSAGMLLLRDIQAHFDDDPHRAKITSAELLQKLCAAEDSPWSEWSKGKPITTAKIARYLKPFGVAPRTIKVESDRTAKGYYKVDFEDAFARYIPVQSVTPSQPLSTKGYSDFKSITHELRVTDQIGWKPAENKHSYGVTLSTGDVDGVEVF